MIGKEVNMARCVNHAGNQTAVGRGVINVERHGRADYNETPLLGCILTLDDFLCSGLFLFFGANMMETKDDIGDALSQLPVPVVSPFVYYFRAFFSVSLISGKGEVGVGIPPRYRPTDCEAARHCGESQDSRRVRGDHAVRNKDLRLGAQVG